jgi:hypothetical protein
MATTDRVNIEMKVSGAGESASSIGTVNTALGKTEAINKRVAASASGAGEQTRKAEEGLRAIRAAISVAFPQIGMLLEKLHAMKFIGKGIEGVFGSAGAAIGRLAALFANPIGLAVAGLAAILGVLVTITSQTKKWEEAQKKASDAAEDAANKLRGTQEDRQKAGQAEARAIIQEAGAMGLAPTADQVTQTQALAKRLQESVPLATPEQAMKAATVSVMTGLSEETAARGLGAQAFGTGVTAPAGALSPAEAARASLEISAATLSPSQASAINLARSIAPASVNKDTVGAFAPTTAEEAARQRLEAHRKMVDVQAAANKADEEGSGVGNWLIGAMSGPSLWRERDQARDFARRGTPGITSTSDLGRTVYNNCVVNNRPGEPTGALGPKPESVIPVN